MASKNDKEGKYSSVQKAALIILLIAALGVFVFPGYMLIERQSEYNASRNEYDNLRDQFKQTEQAADAAPSPIDFDGLKQENPETVGWIEIPSAGISYPVVQAEDNEKYLTTGFDGNESKSGAIFLDYKSQPDMMGYHTIIYGHHMRDGSMFANLVDFKDADYFEKKLSDNALHARTHAEPDGNRGVCAECFGHCRAPIRVCGRRGFSCVCRRTRKAFSE